MSGIATRERQVIVAEGKRDTTFLEAVFATTGQDARVVDIGSKPVDPLRRHESNELAKFDTWGQCDLLVKSEGGRPNVEQVFPSLVRDLCRIGVRGTLLVDLDGEELPALIEGLNTRLGDAAVGPDARLVADGEVTRSGHLLAREYDLVAGDTRESRLTVLAFRESLEDAAGIDKSVDGPDERDEKARTLADDERMQTTIVQTVL